jgi:hypothetical protein
MNVFCEGGWEGIWNDAVAAGRLHSLHLFQNNYVPVLSDVVGNYTEATFSGYASATLAWGAAFINGSTQAEIDATPVTFAHSSGGVTNTIYGIYVLDSGGALAYAERFGAPISMATSSDSITYTAKATMINQ